MGRLFWRNSVLLLRISLFFVYTPANFEGTLAGFPPDFCLFYPGNFSHSTKPAPAVFGLVVEIGQHRPSLAPRCALPHPLQNRVPRVQVLLPLPKKRRKHWVFVGFLFSCVAWLCGSLWFDFWIFSLPRTCRTPSPAPGTHPVSPFSGFSGYVFLFFAAFWPQNFHAGFCASCRIVVTS